MPECTNCGTQVGESDNYCSNCGKPQNPTAQNRLDQKITKRANQQATQQAGSSQSTGQRSQREELIERAGYAFGFIFVVSAISVLPSLGGVFTLLGGILLFPPVRQLSARVFGSPLKAEFNAAVAVVLMLIGTAVHYLL
jgi:hypothetical protein